MPVSSSTEHWIKPDALTINLNHFGDPDYLQVSVLAGAVVMAFKQDVIGYNAAHNYRTWPLEAANTYLETTSAVNVYAKLTRSEVNARALIAYDTVLRDIEGREITYAEDGSEILGEPSPDLYYVFLGQISASVNSNSESVQREWTIDFRAGNLDTNQYRNEESTGEWSKMFRLNKVTDLIEILKTISSAVINKLIVAKELVLFGKVVTDVKRSTDEELSTNDTTIPTTQYLENKFLSKNKDDRSSGIIASDKGFEAGNLVKGATGAGVYKDANENWVVETDNLKVRKKLSASDVDIQTTNHIGGQMMLTAARMKVDYVVESDNYYRCYFLKKDSDGNVINNEWKIGDQAYCNTFNLEKQADGTIGNHYFWRKVVGKSSGNEDEESIVVGDETINASDYHYVDLSKNDCAVDSSIPKNGDKVVHLGYQGNDDEDRQNAIVIAGDGSGSPYIQLFVGINSYSLPEPEQLKPNDNRLSGVLNIKGGSTGWQNFEGLPEEIQKAVDAAEEAKSSYENLEYGKNNLLRNSGFTGDYVTASLGGDTSLKETSQMFSPSLKYWEATNATAQESELSESGKEVLILSGGSLQQTMFFKVIANEKYIFSFRGKGQSITFSVGGYVENISLTSEWASYVSKFTTSFEGQIFSIRANGDCTLCELQLERGTIKSAWGSSPLDNRSELAKYDSLTYLSNLLKATTTIMGGVVNTGYINMGNLNDNGELAETTAGVSGIYNDDSSVAYFAGGNLEKAIYTVATYLDNPNYTPTQEELNNMAKFVVTHGGRAILNDIILRGYIYALGGMFKGTVDIASGKIKLNADGSGQLADGAVEWNKYGIMYRKSHENVKWVNVSSEFSESMIIDLKKGTYLDVTEGLNPNPYILPDSEYDGVTLSLLYTHASRSNQPAVLSGNFKAFVKTDDGYTRVSGNELTLSEDGIEYELTYDSKEAAWVYMGKGVSIEGNRIVLGKVIESKTDVQANSVAANSFVANGNYGLTKVVTIYGRDATYTLNFTAGILTGVNETYDS